MCGIAGIVNAGNRPVSASLLRRMTDALAHRGPDGEGVWTAASVGLGHRRLAIQDLSPAAHQPMLTQDGRFALVYNGEVYNFQELRAELESLGHAFRSRSDSEVVLHAYAEWGPACVERFNGMFAFAVWDAHERELFLARDRYGIKPLYYSLQGGAFSFASEQKALLELPEIGRVIDLPALLEYFTFQNIFTDRTFFKSIRMFPAGCWARLRPGKSSVALAPTRYWDFDFREPEAPEKEADYIEELDRLLRRAVSRQLVSDVAVGAYLSGGMDSGSITAIAAPQRPGLATFTCGFDLRSASGLELSFDERKNAEWMSCLFKTEHYEMVLKAGDMERVLPSLAFALEEPRVGQSYPNYCVSKLASKFVKVVLSGTGGDEMFAGYPWRYFRAVSCSGFEDYIDRYYLYWKRLVDNRDLRRLFRPSRKEVSGVWTRDIFRDVFQPDHRRLNGPQTCVNNSLYFEAKTFLHGLLVVEDKLGMAHGLETRLPLLDNDLVDFAMRLPVGLKLKTLRAAARADENSISKYALNARSGKMILRKVMRRHVPPEIANARKQGFSAPDASWFRGESIDYVRRTLLTPHARVREFLDPGTIERLVRQHLDGRVNRRLFIWSLLSFEWWLRRYYA